MPHSSPPPITLHFFLSPPRVISLLFPRLACYLSIFRTHLSHLLLGWGCLHHSRVAPRVCPTPETQHPMLPPGFSLLLGPPLSPGPACYPFTSITYCNPPPPGWGLPALFRGAPSGCPAPEPQQPIVPPGFSDQALPTVTKTERPGRRSHPLSHRWSPAREEGWAPPSV